MTDGASKRQYRVLGMDCARDAAEIEAAVRGLPEIGAVRVSTATQILTLDEREAEGRLPDIERVVGGLGYRLESLSHTEEQPATAPAHTAPQYRRALWIVVVLNVGYGLVEMAGGFLAGSQALKADALDFLGDGLITFLGLLAIGWSLAWRARAALIQGIFLGVLGLGIVVDTAYRFFAQGRPEPELMGALGIVALAVNVTAAAVLLPHRAGDANVRAVWLFSRNDAIGNLAVVVAAGVVAWTGTSWPDLAVALVVAGLFLQSSWSIFIDARRDLRDSPALHAT